MRDRELFDAMADAASRATAACVAAGYSVSDKVTKDSAFAAADEVHRRERPEDYAPKPAPPVEHREVEDSWRDRADVGA